MPTNDPRAMSPSDCGVMTAHSEVVVQLRLHGYPAAADLIEEQARTIAELREEVRTQIGNVHRACDDRDQFQHELAALRAAHAELLKDAERYRYLQTQRCDAHRLIGGDDELCYLDLNPRDMDAAIDAAIAQEQQNGRA